MRNKKLIMILISILLILITVAIIVNVKISKDKPFTVNFKDRINDTNTFETKAIVDGWIQVQGTNIDLPVISHKVYLDGSEDYHYAWLGSYDYDNYTRKTIGSHNVLNVSSIPTKDMTNLEDFEGLMAFVYYGFAKDNLYIKYTSAKDQKEYIYKIYAIGFYNYTSLGLDELNKENKEGITEYIDLVKKKSIYNYDVDVNNEDELLMLFTCTRMFGSDTKQQIFIDARRLREDEQIERYNVEKTDLFYEYKLYE